MGFERFDPRGCPAVGIAVLTNSSSAVATPLEVLLVEQTMKPHGIRVGLPVSRGPAKSISPLQYTDFPKQVSQVDILSCGRHWNKELDKAVSLGTATTHRSLLHVALRASIGGRIPLFLPLFGIVGYESSLIGRRRVIVR